MTTIPELDFVHTHFLDRSTLVFGESGTGKSSVIIDILNILKPHVGQIIVFAPTDRQNHTYDSGVVPLPCIHYTITSQLLDDIWERQSALATVTKKVNRPGLLESLFKRSPNNAEAKATIMKVFKSMSAMKEEANTRADAAAQIRAMDEKCRAFITTLWKKTIRDNREALLRLPLNNDEQFAIKYLDINPRMVIIFDDCTDMMAKLKNHQVMQKLFYQGRHSSVTPIIAAHTDKVLGPELKKNAFVTIFTSDTCANSYFNRKTGDFDNDSRAKALNTVRVTFSPLVPFQKLVWIRESKKFFRYTATLHTGFRFGSDHVWAYCDMIEANEGEYSLNNKFLGDFTG